MAGAAANRRGTSAKAKRKVKKKDTSCWTSFSSRNRSFFYSWNFLRSRLRTLEVRSEPMHAGDAALLVICALLFGYLLYALLKAEEF
jgi:K+-transporting ATPase KdpF subunit